MRSTTTSSTSKDVRPGVRDRACDRASRIRRRRVSISPAILGAFAAVTVVAGTARAATNDVNPPLPNVLILLDTSGPRTTPAAAPADDLPAEQAAERDRIIAALDACVGNQSNAAKQLGISRANLVNKLALYRVPRPRDKKR